jgi:probable HAF family extracellular repeat protein
MKHLTSIAASLILVTLCSNPAPAARPTYSITDLGTLGGTYTTAIALNAAGQVTGISDTGQNSQNAFFYDGAIHDLGSLGGAYSVGFGINQSGHVTGYSESLDEFAFHAFLYDGMLHDLGTLGGATSFGYGVNASGQVTGSSTLGGELDETRAFLWTQAAGMQNLGTLGGPFSAGHDINDSGHVTGGLVNTDGEYRAFLYDGVMHDLGTLGGTYSYGHRINASGQITGTSMTAEGAFRPFLYDGSMHDLGSLGGTRGNGNGINSSGQVVGETQLAGDETTHAFLYTASQGMVDLNSLIDPLFGWELLHATAINDSGQIVGNGRFDGADHAFLLTPVQVPEPSSWVLVVAAFACIVIGLRSRHARFRSGRHSS